MREQVIASRPRRANGQGKGVAQRPMRRDVQAAESRFSVRALLGYVPTAMKIAVIMLALIGVAIGYRAASSAALFQVRAVDVVGTSRTSGQEIEGLVRRAVSRTGVWRADLDVLSNDLTRLPGVRRAVVTRVLPDRLRVRITERVPLAVVRTVGGHFVWVDEEGIALGEMKTNDQMPPFFILGWNEDGTNEARVDNVERVKKYQEALREWQGAGLTERISEINLIDVRDVRAQLAGPDSQIEVRLGSQDLGKRLKTALDVLDEYKQTPRGASITYVDFQGDRVVLGFNSGGKISAGTDDANTAADQGASISKDANVATPASLTNRKTEPKGISPANETRARRAVDNKPVKENRARTR